MLQQESPLDETLTVRENVERAVADLTCDRTSRNRKRARLSPGSDSPR